MISIPTLNSPNTSMDGNWHVSMPSNCLLTVNNLGVNALLLFRIFTLNFAVNTLTAELNHNTPNQCQYMRLTLDSYCAPSAANVSSSDWDLFNNIFFSNEVL